MFVRHSLTYQLALRTPGIAPWSASFLKQMRQMPNLRYTARGRPHNLQRRRSRVVNLGVSLDLAILDLLATLVLPCQNQRVCYLPLPVGTSTAWNGMPSIVSSSRDSSLFEFEITMAMFMPCTRVNLSGLSSGNTSCSAKPRL